MFFRPLTDEETTIFVKKMKESQLFDQFIQNRTAVWNSKNRIQVNFSKKKALFLFFLICKNSWFYLFFFSIFLR